MALSVEPLSLELDKHESIQLMASFIIIELHSDRIRGGNTGITDNLDTNRQHLESKYFTNPDGFFSDLKEADRDSIRNYVVLFIQDKSKKYGTIFIKNYNNFINLYKLLIDLLIQKYIFFNNIDPNILKNIIKQIAELVFMIQNQFKPIDTTLPIRQRRTPYFTDRASPNHALNILSSLLNNNHDVPYYLSMVNFFQSMVDTNTGENILDMEVLLSYPTIFNSLSLDSPPLSIFCQRLFYNIVVEGVKHEYSSRTVSQYIVVADRLHTISSIDIELIVYPMFTDLQTHIDNLTDKIRQVIHNITTLIAQRNTDITNFLSIFNELAQSIALIQTRITDYTSTSTQKTSHLQTILAQRDEQIKEIGVRMSQTDDEKTRELAAMQNKLDETKQQYDRELISRDKVIAQHEDKMRNQIQQIDHITAQLKISIAQAESLDRTIQKVLAATSTDVTQEVESLLDKEFGLVES